MDLISGPEVVRLTSVTMRESSEYMVLFHGITIYAEEMTSGRNIRWKFLRMSIMS